MGHGVTSGRCRGGPAAEGSSRQRQGVSEHPPGVERVDDAVVPEPCGRVVGAALLLVLLADRLAERLLVLGRPLEPARLELVAVDRGEHRRRLLAAHDRDARVGPHPEEARRVGPPAHRVVAGAVRAADDDGELGHPRAGDGGDHLGAVLGDAAGLGLAADHEAGDVLQEHQGNAAGVAELDEVRALDRRLGEEHAVVGDDADRVAVDVGGAGDERLAVLLLELQEPAAVDEAGDDLAHVVEPARVGRDDGVEVGGVDRGRLGSATLPGSDAR